MGDWKEFVEVVVPLNPLVSISPVVLVSVLEKIKCLFVDSVERFVDVLSVITRKSALGIVLPSLFNNLSSVVKIETVLLDNVQNVVDLGYD